MSEHSNMEGMISLNPQAEEFIPFPASNSKIIYSQPQPQISHHIQIHPPHGLSMGNTGFHDQSSLLPGHGIPLAPLSQITTTLIPPTTNPFPGIPPFHLQNPHNAHQNQYFYTHSHTNNNNIATHQPIYNHNPIQFMFLYLCKINFFIYTIPYMCVTGIKVH